MFFCLKRHLSIFFSSLYLSFLRVAIMESILYPVTAEDVIALVNLWRQIAMQRQFEREERLKREQVPGARPSGPKEHTI
ncbi:unnamed protein product [Dibothriocephalus latus]|uniref:Uncharacterized protein n=1 Tax=Dibothriocephalus latus TaxID=60516 RepID=A0A3P7M026_DIBLA|nr:unnamed protein product [Dibothriocephalus latus]